MKLNIKLLALSLTTCVGMAYAKKIVHEAEVFGKWHAWQQIVEDVNLKALASNIDEEALALIKSTYEENIAVFGGARNFLHAATAGRIGANGYFLRPPVDPQMKRNFEVLHQLVEENTSEFVNVLAKSGLAGKTINAEDEGKNYDQVIAKYKALSHMLFPVADEFKRDETQIAFANRLVEYTLGESTFPHYQSLLSHYEEHPTVRFIHTVMWNALVGFGWKHWHSDCIKALSAETKAGKEIVYIAGGTDFYQLMRKDIGIYSMTIIDPFLPTQARYYSEGWQFLIDGEVAGGGLEDEIRFGPGFDSIKLVRTSHKSSDSFSLKMSNNQIGQFKKTETIWTVVSRHGQKLGEIKILRRPVTQEDFAFDEHKVLLSSYDEAAYIALPENLAGWGIDPLVLDNRAQILVKQLRKPMTKQMLINLRVAGMINFSDVKFINFASDPT